MNAKATMAPAEWNLGEAEDFLPSNSPEEGAGAGASEEAS